MTAAGPLGPPTQGMLRADGPDASLLASVEGFVLASKRLAHHAVAGMHRAVGRGTSIAFAEHKLYAPGDDIRRLDWHLYARTDRYYVKQYEDHASLTVSLWLDCSGSMAFAHGGRAPKLHVAAHLAAAIAHLALLQGDAAGCVLIADGRIVAEVPARRGLAHFAALAWPMFATRAHGQTHLGDVLSHLCSRRRRRQTVVLFSDLLDTDPGALTPCHELAALGHDVAVMHVLDPMEMQFNYDEAATFVAMEGAAQLYVHPRHIRDSYRSQMRQLIDAHTARLRAAGIWVVPAYTDVPPIMTLRAFLRPFGQGRH